MSAFLVSENHVKAIIVATIDKHSDMGDMNAKVNILWEENKRSVDIRYSLRSDMTGDWHELEITEEDIRRLKKITPVEALVLCSSLEYYSWQSKDWEDTEAFRLLNLAIKDIFKKLPGFKEAPWCID